MRQSTGKYIKQLSEYFSDSENISLVCHTNPDGDAIGSMVGLYYYLTTVGKSCNMIAPSALPQYLNWMTGTEKIIVYQEDKNMVVNSLNGSDLIIFLDFNSISRTGKMQSLLVETGKKLVLIDHHPEPDIPAGLVISEPGFSSTSELVYDLVSHLNQDGFNHQNFNEAIYTGMMTDTGNFSFGTYDGQTMRIVGSLLESGLRKDYITDKVYDNFSADRMRLKGFALAERMVVLEEYRAAYIYLSKSDLDRFNHSVGDTEGFVNMPLSIRDISLSVLFIEKDDHVKLSLRSKGNFSVNDMARAHFNGGGHRNAAGGRFRLPLVDCVNYFESLLNDYIKDLTNDD